MIFEKLYGKLSEVIITGRSLECGSIIIDENLMDAAGIKKYDVVEVNGKTSSSRIRTYVLPGTRGSGIVEMRGGAALHFTNRDRVHILKFYWTDGTDDHQPFIVDTNEKNQIKVPR